MKSTEIANIPENYRKAQGVEDFNIGDIVYTNLNKGTVNAIVPHVCIKWDNLTYITSYAPFQLVYLYVQNRTKQDKPNKPKFKVGDRVEWTGYEFKLKGTVTSSCLDLVYIKWDASSYNPSHVNYYNREHFYLIKLLPKLPKETKEVTVDLKLHFNLDTSGIETVLIDCVKATVANGKYQEAKELCELLLSVQALAKPKDEHSKAT